MTTDRFYPYAKATERVLRWCDWYTRGLDDTVARGRRDEIVSDIWEHTRWADRRNEAPEVTSRVILTRAVLGAVADLNWRRAQRRSARLAESPGTAPSSRTVLALALSLAAMLLAFGIFVLVRGSIAAPDGYIRDGSRGLVATAVATALCALGIVLLARDKTRLVGALWMIPTTVGLVHFGLRVLELVSTTVGSFALSALVTQWDLVTLLASLAVALVFGCFAIAWWPRRAAVAGKEF